MWPINQYLLVEYPSRHIRGHIGPKRRLSETLPGQNELLSPLVWSIPNLTQLADIFRWKMHNFLPRASSGNPEEAYQGMPRHHETNRVGYRDTSLALTPLWNSQFATFVTSSPTLSHFGVANTQFPAWRLIWRQQFINRECQVWWTIGGKIQNLQDKSNKFNYKGHFRNHQEFFEGKE